MADDNLTIASKIDDDGEKSMTDNPAINPPNPSHGDYVLATKYHDGDTGDQYVIGFYNGNYDHFGQVRHMVVDSNGKNFRANGFRRVEKISDAEGRWMIANGFSELPLSTSVETGDPEDPERLEGTVWDFLATCRARTLPE